MSYFVVIDEPGGGVSHGPMSLYSAKDFARIGSQTGADRIVTRGHRGEVVRVYSGGERTYPVSEEEAWKLKPAERPRKV